MGLLRFLFAISVVGAHTWPGTLLFVGGRNAVQCFFIFSGFIITYILVDSKKYSISQFYISRLVRLFPTYLLILTTTYLLYLFSGFSSEISINFFSTLFNLSIDGKFLLFFTNILLIGQDIIMFMSINGSQLSFTSDFRNSDILLFYGLLVPQAWSVSLEIYFYLLAPFIVKRILYLFILLVISIFIRFYLYKIGLVLQDPWIYRFFPAELFFFIVGSISYLIIYKKILIGKKILNLKISIFFVALILSYCIFFNFLPGKEIIKTSILFSVVTITLPFLYIFNNNFKYDQLIGELSYPIYISHFLVMFIVRWIGISDPYFYSILTIILTVFLSLIILFTVEKPIKLWKYNFLAKKL